MKKVTIKTPYADGHELGQTIMSILFDDKELINNSGSAKFKHSFTSQVVGDKLTTYHNKLRIHVDLINKKRVADEGGLLVYESEVNEKEMQKYLKACKYQETEKKFQS